MTNDTLDKCCKFKNSFYATGFCRFDYAAEICVDLEEVTAMFMNWSITDPVSGELIAIAGGDDEDVGFQQVLDAFVQDGLHVRPFDIGA